jgi:HSP20 family protein
VARRNPEVWFWQAGGDLLQLGGEGNLSPRRVGARNFWEPRIDLIEDERHFYLKVELAGVRRDDVQLVYLPDRHSMLIRGVRREEKCFDSERTGAHQLEVYYGEFEREVPLPDFPIEPSEVRAQFENGFLNVLVPKAKAAFRHTKISIRRV